MDLKLFKPVDNSGIAILIDLPVVYISIVGGGEEMPVVPWASFESLSSFKDLVTGQSEEKSSKPRIILVKDEDASLRMVSLVSDNSGTIGVAVIRVTGLSHHVSSAQADNAFWGTRIVSWNDWKDEIEEAVRVSALSAREGLSRDERKREDATRSNGTIKSFDHDNKVVPVSADAVDVDTYVSDLSF